MGLGDITGVLSRYFLVGYFIPSFVALFSLALSLSDGLIPNQFEQLSWASKVAVLGIAAIVTGLALLGLQYPITRVLEGYPLEFGLLRRIGLRRPLVWLQGRSYDRLLRIRDDEREPSAARTTAARLLDRRFHRSREKLLPTRFGNAYRAFENYSYTRYGLDFVATWPRIDPLLNEQERELHTNASSDLAFFVNGAVSSTIAGVLIAADAERDWWIYPLPFILAFVLYRASIGTVERLGTERRASVDLHRLEMYEKLGLRRPNSPEEERDQLARAINRFLLWGEPIPTRFFQLDESEVSSNASSDGELSRGNTQAVAKPEASWHRFWRIVTRRRPRRT
jgi:hypothetical protein